MDLSRENMERLPPEAAAAAAVQGTYEYGADFAEGTQDAECCWVVENYKAGSGKLWNKVTLGLPPIVGRTSGAKTDLYLPLCGPKLLAVIRALAPDALGRPDFNAQELVGQVCRVEIKGEEFNGRNDPKVCASDDGMGNFIHHITAPGPAAPAPAPAPAAAPASPASPAGSFFSNQPIGF